MPLSRYRNDDVILGGTTLQTNRSIRQIRDATRGGFILYNERPLQEGERLDTIAFNVFGDGSLWWVIAAMSNIGWWLQVPAGTLVRIPVSAQEVAKYL